MNVGASLAERLTPASESYRAALDAFARRLRVAVPGIIQSFDAAKQTVSVQPAITENVLLDGRSTPTALPLLVDVPLCLPRAGGFTLTMPIQKGDECLVVFGDFCIDSWWQSGCPVEKDGKYVPQNQAEQRRHDLSDGFAIVGPWSQTRVLSGYNANAAELRSDDGVTKVTVASGQITLTAQNVTVNASNTATIQGQHVNITGSSDVTISGNNTTKVDGKVFLTHKHTSVASGTSQSGTVA